MDFNDSNTKKRKYAVRTPEGTARIYTVSYEAREPENEFYDARNCLLNKDTDSAHSSYSPPGVDNPRASYHSGGTASTKCMSFWKKPKATLNESDAYVFMDTNSSNVIILDNGKPFNIPVSISGKYSITNTASSLNIKIKKDKFGNQKRSNLQSCNAQNMQNKRSEEMKKEDLEKNGWFQPKLVRIKTVVPPTKTCKVKGSDKCCCKDCGH